MNKKFMSSLLALGMLGSLLTGCSNEATPTDTSQNETQSTTTGTTKGSNTIRVSWWGNQVRNDNTVAMIELFKQENPDVNVEYDFIDWNGYWDKIATQVAGNNLPDVMQQDYLYLNQYVSKNLITDLTPYVDNGILNLDDVEETFLSGGRIDGKLYAVNLGANAPAIIYDPAALQEAGIEVKPQMTYDEFYEVSKAVYEKTGMQSNMNFTSAQIELAVRSIGKQLYSEDGKSLGFDDPSIVQYLFEMGVKGIEEGICPPIEVLNEASAVETSTLAIGRSWNAFAFSNQIVAFEAAAGKELSLMMQPTLENATTDNMYLKPSQFFAVAESSANKEAAVKFIDFYTNSIEAYKIMLAERGVPISSKVREALQDNLSPTEKKMFDYVDYVGQHSTPIAPPAPTGGGQIDKLAAEMSDTVLYKQITPEQGAKQYIDDANRILKEAQQ